MLLTVRSLYGQSLLGLAQWWLLVITKRPPWKRSFWSLGPSRNSNFLFSLHHRVEHSVIKHCANFYENQTYQTFKIAYFVILSTMRICVWRFKGLRNYLKFVINYYILFSFNYLNLWKQWLANVKDPQKPFSSQTCSVKISVDLIIDINVNKIKININVNDVNTGWLFIFAGSFIHF